MKIIVHHGDFLQHGVRLRGGREIRAIKPAYGVNLNDRLKLGGHDSPMANGATAVTRLGRSRLAVRRMIGLPYCFLLVILLEVTKEPVKGALTRAASSQAW
jgi:hypothetical protein